MMLPSISGRPPTPSLNSSVSSEGDPETQRLLGDVDRGPSRYSASTTPPPASSPHLATPSPAPLSVLRHRNVAPLGSANVSLPTIRTYQPQPILDPIGILPFQSQLAKESPSQWRFLYLSAGQLLAVTPNLPAEPKEIRTQRVIQTALIMYLMMSMSGGQKSGLKVAWNLRLVRAIGERLASPKNPIKDHIPLAQGGLKMVEMFSLWFASYRKATVYKLADEVQAYLHKAAAYFEPNSIHGNNPKGNVLAQVGLSYFLALNSCWQGQAVRWAEMISEINHPLTRTTAAIVKGAYARGFSGDPIVEALYSANRGYFFRYAAAERLIDILVDHSGPDRRADYFIIRRRNYTPEERDILAAKLFISIAKEDNYFGNHSLQELEANFDKEPTGFKEGCAKIALLLRRTNGNLNPATQDQVNQIWQKITRSDQSFPLKWTDPDLLENETTESQYYTSSSSSSSAH